MILHIFWRPQPVGLSWALENSSKSHYKMQSIQAGSGLSQWVDSWWCQSANRGGRPENTISIKWGDSQGNNNPRTQLQSHWHSAYTLQGIIRVVIFSCDWWHPNKTCLWVVWKWYCCTDNSMFGSSRHLGAQRINDFWLNSSCLIGTTFTAYLNLSVSKRECKCEFPAQANALNTLGSFYIFILLDCHIAWSAMNNAAQVQACDDWRLWWC